MAVIWNLEKKLFANNLTVNIMIFVDDNIILLLIRLFK